MFSGKGIGRIVKPVLWCDLGVCVAVCPSVVLRHVGITHTWPLASQARARACNQVTSRACQDLIPPRGSLRARSGARTADCAQRAPERSEGPTPRLLGSQAIGRVRDWWLMDVYIHELQRMCPRRSSVARFRCRAPNNGHGERLGPCEQACRVRNFTLKKGSAVVGRRRRPICGVKVFAGAPQGSVARLREREGRGAFKQTVAGAQRG